MVLDPPSEFDEMSKSDRDRLLLLCKEYFQPIKSINTKRSSYWLKHRIQWVDNGMYCTNGQFKGAMLALGFYSTDIEHSQNCHFNVSEKPKAIALAKSRR